MTRSTKPRCPTCGNVMRNSKRCGPCVGGTPNPGTPGWRRWTSGICRTIRARLWAAGLGCFDMEAVMALVFDRGVCPPEAAPLLTDIAALPCSYVRYQVVLEKALNEVGLSMRLPRPRPLLRVAVPRVRVEVLEDGAGEHEAEHEAAAVEEARAAR